MEDSERTKNDLITLLILYSFPAFITFSGVAVRKTRKKAMSGM
jgi:hypothetical protein